MEALRAPEDGNLTVEQLRRYLGVLVGAGQGNLAITFGEADGRTCAICYVDPHNREGELVIT